MFSGFFIMLLVLFIKTFVTMVTKIKDFYVRRSLDIEWYIYIDIVVVALCIASIIYWFTMFIKNRNDFSIPFSEESQFEKWC